MKRKYTYTVIALLMILALSGCSSYKMGRSNTASSSDMSMGETESMPEMVSEKKMMEQDNESKEMTLSEDESPSPAPAPADNPFKNRKIIMTGDAYIETLEYEKTLSQLEAMVKRYGGYIERANSQGQSIFDQGFSQRSAWYTVKIPAEHFYDIFNGLESIGHVLNQNKGIEDVTSQFVDVEARLKTLAVQEARLLDILEKTTTLEDIVELEYALQDVRLEIEMYTSTLRNLNERVRFSTLTIQIQEVYKETIIDKPAITFGERINEGIKQTFKNIRRDGEDFVVGFIANLPYLLFWGILILIAILLIKRGMKRRKIQVTKKKKEIEEVVVDTEKEGIQD